MMKIEVVIFDKYTQYLKGFNILDEVPTEEIETVVKEHISPEIIKFAKKLREEK